MVRIGGRVMIPVSPDWGDPAYTELFPNAANKLLSSGTAGAAGGHQSGLIRKSWIDTNCGWPAGRRALGRSIRVKQKTTVTSATATVALPTLCHFLCMNPLFWNGLKRMY